MVVENSTAITRNHVQWAVAARAAAVLIIDTKALGFSRLNISSSVLRGVQVTAKSQLILSIRFIKYSFV